MSGKEGSKQGKVNTGRWSQEEHSRFIEAINIFGKDWKRVQQYVGTRTSAQSRSHAQKVLPKTLGEDNHQVACTPQKKLEPLETAFNKFEAQSNGSVKDEGSKNVIEYEPPVPQTEIFKPHLDDSEEVPKLNCSRHLSHVAPFEKHKRKWTVETPLGNFEDDLLIENDEVSQRLLQKLTTPKQTNRLMSFSYHDDQKLGLKLDFDSDIESIDDQFKGSPSFDMPPLNEYIAKSMGNSYF